MKSEWRLLCPLKRNSMTIFTVLELSDQSWYDAGLYQVHNFWMAENLAKIVGDDIQKGQKCEDMKKLNDLRDINIVPIN